MDRLEQRRQVSPQTMGKPFHVVDRYVSLGALHGADIGAMDNQPLQPDLPVRDPAASHPAQVSLRTRRERFLSKHAWSRRSPLDDLNVDSRKVASE